MSALLHYIARDLSQSTKYPEKKINAIVAEYQDDTATIRRHIMESGVLARGGESVYWVVKTVIR